MRPARAPILVVLAVLLLAGGIADRAERPRPATTPRGAAGRALMPTAAPEGALSSTWYCAGATAAPGGGANGAVMVANTLSRSVQGFVAVVPTQGETRTQPLTVGPLSLTSVDLGQVAQGPFAAAVVDVDAGQVVVELVVTGPHGSDASPCASAASPHWYFADGSTAKDATLALSLFNPFPEDAIADLSFATDQGRAVPSDFQGIVVPGRSLVVKDIGAHVRRREAIATEVAVRSGRLVAAQTQTRTAPGRAGVSLALGSPSPGTVWYFPDGLVSDGVVERFALANPGEEEAEVLVEVNLDQGVAEPFELSVPARGRLELVLNQEPRIPKDVAHTTTVRSLNAVPVVVTRAIEAAPPAPRIGRADTVGARRSARRWAFAAGGATETVDEWIVVSNVGTRSATLSITGLADGQRLLIDGLQGLTVAPGRRQAYRIGDHVKRAPLPLVVHSSVPVVVERARYDVGRSGLWATVGVPLG